MVDSTGMLTIYFLVLNESCGVFFFFFNLHQCALIGILDIESSWYFLLTLCDQPVL